MPPILRFWEAAVWMEPFTALRGRPCWRNAGGWAAVKTGRAKLTQGYNLRARYVIHTPGPIWQGGNMGEPALLASCYRSSLQLAADHGIRTVDFPSISTGIYGYPLAQAATVALKAIMEFLQTHPLPQRVRMVCHSEAAAAVYRQTWNLWYAERSRLPCIKR